MHRRHLLIVLPIFALLFPTARKASARPPDTQIKPTAEATATAVVEKRLVTPLAEKEERRISFSRAYIAPLARRVRVLAREQSTDGHGAAFVPFAIDESFGGFSRRADNETRRWRKDVIVGCVYPARDEVFIKRGDKFFAAGLLLGKKTAAADDTVCRPGHTPSASNDGNSAKPPTTRWAPW